VIIAFGAVFGIFLRRISTQIQDELAGATVVTEEVLQNIREVKSFVREPYEISRYQTAIGRAFTAAIRFLRVRSLFGPLIAFLGFGALAVILWFGGREVIDGRLSGGQLIGFLIYGITVAGACRASSRCCSRRASSELPSRRCVQPRKTHDRLRAVAGPL